MTHIPRYTREQLDVLAEAFLRKRSEPMNSWETGKCYAAEIIPDMLADFAQQIMDAVAEETL